MAADKVKPQTEGNAKKQRKGAIKRELGYTNESNPFGDNTLTEKFVWRKKNEYLNAAGLYQKADQQQQLERVEAKLSEIQRVKVRRDEREVEKQLLEKQRLEHNKERIQEDFDDWIHKEEHFHLEMAKTRSNLRIEQGRERPIDLIAKGLAIAEGESFEDMTILDKYPHLVIPNMNAKDVQSMADEVYHFLKIETQSGAQKFWKAMQFILKDCLEQKQSSKQAQGRIGAGIADGVQQDVHDLLSAKKRPELEEMLVEIKASLKGGGGDGMDTQFFDSVAQKLPLYMARPDIEDVHDRALERVQAWRAAGGGREPVKEGYERETKNADSDNDDISIADGDITGGESDGDEKKGDWDDLPDDGNNPQGGDLSPELEPLDNHNDDGAFSPILEKLDKFDAMDLIDPDEDERMRRDIKNTLIEGYRGLSAAQSGIDRGEDDKLFEAEQKRGMGTDEAAFNAGLGSDEHGEVTLAPKKYEWEDKYRPRKPRFFNRVKTGYEWNKYNQTHYDHDNPPPKVVQGYKFNIFYPDLINKVQAPTYCLQKSIDGDPKETITLRFTAGPPYEDVAFKVVNRQWNMSHKFGFRCVFERGVLQLYFNFHRWRYRR